MSRGGSRSKTSCLRWCKAAALLCTLGPDLATQPFNPTRLNPQSLSSDSQWATNAHTSLTWPAGSSPPSEARKRSHPIKKSGSCDSSVERTRFSKSSYFYHCPLMIPLSTLLHQHNLQVQWITSDYKGSTSILQAQLKNLSIYLLVLMAIASLALLWSSFYKPASLTLSSLTASILSLLFISVWFAIIQHSFSPFFCSFSLLNCSLPSLHQNSPGGGESNKSAVRHKFTALSDHAAGPFPCPIAYTPPAVCPIHSSGVWDEVRDLPCKQRGKNKLTSKLQRKISCI